jgi:hypothetical protein
VIVGIVFTLFVIGSMFKPFQWVVEAVGASIIVSPAITVLEGAMSVVILWILYAVGKFTRD